MAISQRQRILSGITSSGKLTLGNYLGAIKNFLKFQDEAELLIFIANLHALTNPITAKELKTNTWEIAAWYFACGIDANKATVFVQSDILEHAQLSYLLMCHSTIGELERMTQFKDKSQKNPQQNKTNSIPSGLLYYPTLMAADILLYDADLVPVGSDQKQHIELTRDLAERINKRYQATILKVPAMWHNEVSHKIMGLKTPTKKMSKSDVNLANVIFLTDTPEQIKNKIKTAVTDSDNQIKYDISKKPGISNLLTIYAAIKNLTISEVEQQFKHQTYAQLKTAVSDVIIELLTPIQNKFHYYVKNQNKVATMLKNGANRAQKIANLKLTTIQDTIGINYGKL